jgi:hypothetical protein
LQGFFQILRQEGELGGLVVEGFEVDEYHTYSAQYLSRKAWGVNTSR